MNKGMCRLLGHRARGSSAITAALAGRSSVRFSSPPIRPPMAAKATSSAGPRNPPLSRRRAAPRVGQAGDLEVRSSIRNMVIDALALRANDRYALTL